MATSPPISLALILKKTPRGGGVGGWSAHILRVSQPRQYIAVACRGLAVTAENFSPQFRQAPPDWRGGWRVHQPILIFSDHLITVAVPSHLKRIPEQTPIGIQQSGSAIAIASHPANVNIVRFSMDVDGGGAHVGSSLARRPWRGGIQRRDWPAQSKSGSLSGGHVARIAAAGGGEGWTCQHAMASDCAAGGWRRSVNRPPFPSGRVYASSHTPRSPTSQTPVVRLAMARLPTVRVGPGREQWRSATDRPERWSPRPPRNRSKPWRFNPRGAAGGSPRRAGRFWVEVSETGGPGLQRRAERQRPPRCLAGCYVPLLPKSLEPRRRPAGRGTRPACG